MSYSKTAIKTLLNLVSNIQDYLSKEKKIMVSDLGRLINFLSDPGHKKICGSMILDFTTQKILQNGSIIQLTETIEFNPRKFSVKSVWHEGHSGIQLQKTDYRITECEPEKYVPFQAAYSWNAIFNILEVNKGTFEIITEDFRIKESK